MLALSAMRTNLRLEEQRVLGCQYRSNVIAGSLEAKICAFQQSAYSYSDSDSSASLTVSLSSFEVVSSLAEYRTRRLDLPLSVWLLARHV